MIISKTPLRMSFVGGGSDLPSFYENSKGAVLTTTIDKYMYITVNKKFDNKIRISYSKTELVNSIDEIEHDIVKAVLKKLNIDGGIEITSIADIPSKGTGLGSSSAFTVGLLNALHAYNQEFASAEHLASKACEIEIDTLQKPIGRQDQYGTAFGGLKLIQFHPQGCVSVNPVICSSETKQNLDKNILMLYTGITRPASSILSNQKYNLESSKQKFALMQKMVQLAYEMYHELQKNNLDGFAEALHVNWMYKKEIVSNISNSVIDNWYNIGRQHGALGGKILGAGAGGFLIFYAPQEKHQAIINALPELKPIEFQFEPEGSKIIFIH